MTAAKQTSINNVAFGVVDILLGYEPEIPKRSIAFEFVRVLWAEGFEAAKSRYMTLRKEAGDRYLFGDRELNQAGYALMAKGQADVPLAIFQFNVELYPEVANCWDSPGEAHMIRGDNEKAVELDPEFENARRMLTKLAAEAGAKR
ncbi:MAG: hypothetical protein ACYS0G_08185 [Planctomycetota bacterium]|jgi:hypothetical protein